MLYYKTTTKKRARLRSGKIWTT